MTKGYFIAGTDTEVGKTFITQALLCHFKKIGLTTTALKPIAAGSNLDALYLQKCCSFPLTTEQINPFFFEQNCSPHIAAIKNKMTLNVKKIIHSCQDVLALSSDVLLIEGAGGWYTPINHNETMASLAKEFRFPVILVVGIRLGCLNHAILTKKAILSDGLIIHGFIANCIDPSMNYLKENIDSLIDQLAVPLLGISFFQKNLPPDPKNINFTF